MEHRMSEGRPWILNEDGSSTTAPSPQEEERASEPGALLDQVLSTPGYQGDALDLLLEMVKSNEIRDYGDQFTTDTFQHLFDLLVRVWKDGSAEVIQAVEWIVSYVVAMPEFDRDQARPEITSSEFVRAVFTRFETAAEGEYRFLRELLHFIYSEFPDSRRLIRALMGRFFVGFTKVWDKRMAVAPMLEVVGQIIKGFRLPLTSVHRSLLITTLLPLHKSNEMYEWRDQIPLLHLYHEPLVFCIRQYLDRDHSLAVPVVEAVLKAWPEGFEGNSPKEVLCLHEIEGLLKYLSDDNFAKVLPSLLPRLARCLKTEHSRCLEKVLQMWKDPTFVSFNKRFSKSLIPALMPNIYRHGEVHWNVTVNKMRAVVLEILHEADPVTFARVAASLTTHGTRPPDPLAEADDGAKPSSSSSSMEPPAPRIHHFGPPKMNFRAGAAGWKPPSRGGTAGQAPPSTITGVAPWAMGGANGAAASQRMPSLGARAGASQQQPPVTITGVAPWVMGEAPGLSHFRAKVQTPQGGVPVRGGMVPPPAKRPLSGEGKKDEEERQAGKSAPPPVATTTTTATRVGFMEPAPALVEGEEEEEEEEDEERSSQAQDKDDMEEDKGDKEEDARRDSKVGPVAEMRGEERRRPSRKEEEASTMMEVDGDEAPPADVDSSEAVQKILAFIKKLRPEGNKAGEKTWHEIQMEATPTLLPDLRFHDLVFGHDLGSGAFSTVKYARLITKGKTRSEWPEYAIKVISTSRIEELGYENCISREIAVLRLLSHPGIARMVSAFRWRDGAYLVLEYASKGDLHTQIVTNGSLSEASTRFVVGEVIAGLKSVHDAGFVYGDLKPENVVITESGHVKITDFGACRPVTDEARAVLRASKGEVRRLRDGDWRAAKREREGARGGDAMKIYEKEEEEKEEMGRGEAEEEEEEDERIEGTYAYLPPEVIRDQCLPDQLADSWALGCLLFHCVAGRPPIFANVNEDVRARVVTFALEDGLRGLLEDASISEGVKGLLQGLLSSEKTRRFTIEAAGVHPFFTDHDTDVYALHRGPAVPLGSGSAAPNPEAAWNRRQFSSIWAPLPGNYNFVSSSYTLSAIPEGDLEFNSPFSYETFRIREEKGGGAGLPVKRPSH